MILYKSLCSYSYRPVLRFSRLERSIFRPYSTESNFKRLFSLALPDKAKLAGAVGLLFVSSAVTMALPFVSGQIIDSIYAQNSSESKDKTDKVIQTQLLSLLIGVIVLGGLCNFGRVYLMKISGQNITARLRSSVYGTILRQDMSFFDKRSTGELVNRLSSDSNKVSNVLTQQMSDGLRSSLMTTAGMAMMFAMSPQLAVVSLGLVPPVAFWAVRMGKKVKGLSGEMQDVLASANELATERISNIRSVRAFTKEKAEMKCYDKQMKSVLDVGVKDALLQAKFYGLTGLSGHAIILSVLFYGGSLVSTNALTVGNLTSFILYSAYVGIGLRGVSTFYAELMKGLGASSRLWELLDRVPKIENFNSGLIPSTSQGNISFRNVDFSYPTRPDFPVLKNCNLKVALHQVLAVVGCSGSGKSTLVSLILRHYDPNAGKIFFDSHDLSSINTVWLRRQIGVVMQEPSLFSTTIRNNITYGSHEPVTEELVIEAAQKANAHEFISHFPKGYDTLVGERGIMLSGGQKQRIAIARAILKDPQILLLDEATSALDSVSEELVQDALSRLMKNRTVVIIAHRLSTIRNADQIAVLHNGSVGEKGSYEELMKRPNGLFKQLVDKQSLLS